MNVMQKILACIILIVLIIVTIAPTVQAVTEEILQNGTEEEILYQHENNIINYEETSNMPTNFEVLLACVLNGEEGESENLIELSEVPSIILQKPTQTGIYIEENSRDYFVSLVNSLTNKTYKIDGDGFLIEDELVSQDKIFDSNYSFYTDKIDELITSENTIFISIEENYCQYNETTNEILSIMIEDDEYALLFKDSEENDNRNDIIILNEQKYNEENTDNTSSYLMNKFLEVYYNEDEDFIHQSSNIEISDDIIIENTNTIEDDTNILVDNSNIVEDNSNILVDDSSTVINIESDNEEINFDTVLSGILYDINNVTIEDISNINNIKPSNYGIWVEENSREIFLQFLNNHGIYTYSINQDGYLVCDKVMKNNPNLDFVDKTEIDIEIENMLEEDITFYVSITSNYLTQVDNVIQTVNLLDTEYVKTFDNGEFTNRIILLNNIYFNSNTGYNIELSDRFVKKIFNYNQGISLLSDTSKTGNMVSAQTVYAGPSGNDYATVGSVDSNEQVYILGQQSGWYHIQYHAGSVQKSGFVEKSTVYNLNVNDSDIHEEQMTGGLRYATQNLSLQSCDDTSISTTLGTVYAGEGLTLLYDYGYTGDNGSYRIAYIEISTSTGTKRGYVYNDQLNAPSYNTSVARVTATNPAYSGPDSSYVKLGGAYYNEFVSILAKDNDWVFVEYNTTSGRKRGFMSYSNLYNYNHPGIYNDLPYNQGLKQATQQLTVYGGPNSNNANIGSIFNQEVVSLFGTENSYAYIEYSTANGAKRGYVLNSYLTNATPPTLPNLTTYTNFTSGIYGYSGLGQELKYYKIGTGENVAFAVFTQHGWEDAWAYDGIELVNIADRMMSSLSSSGISSSWTLYVIPYANPDGITNGYTNNGPGRCTVTTQIDMNRSWPSNFVPNYTSRNYTGDSPLGAPEITALKSFIEHNMGNNQKIILDIHGWLNITYGDSDIGQYFDEEFGFGHSSTYGSGYLQTWAKSIGARTSLIELPMPTSTEDILNRDFSGKLTDGIINMLNNTMPSEGGTEVNEQVEVFSTGDVNIRSGPGTSYSIITSVSNGTSATRIRKSVATANGYVWDKIVLADGTDGYIVSDFLILASSNTFSIDGKIFRKNKTYSSHDSSYTNTKNTEDSLWNTMSTEDKTSKNTELQENYNRLLQAVEDFSDLYPLGSEALSYFLSNQGSSHNIGDIRTLYLIPEQLEVAYTYINRNMRAAEYFTTNQTSSFALDNEYDLKVGDYDADMIDYVLAAQVGDYLSSIRVDWFIAAHSFKMGTYATVERDSDIYKMYINFNMNDYYDWDDSKMPFLLGDNFTELSSYILEEDIRDLHLAGMAKNFESKGTIRVYVEWQAGQTAEEAYASML